jgi:hypothetical protein
MSIKWVTIKHWPHADTIPRQTSKFQVAYEDLLFDISAELEKIKARDIVIQSFLQPHQLRADGWPRAGESPSHPGIIVSFNDRGGRPLSFPCDTYYNYHGNLRAISLSLTALRAIDRYGVTKRAEQYQGWAQLAAPADAPFMSKEDAARWMADLAGVKTPRGLITDEDFRQATYKLAARKVHPDTGGSHEQFVKLQAALKILEAA